MLVFAIHVDLAQFAQLLLLPEISRTIKRKFNSIPWQIWQNLSNALHRQIYKWQWIKDLSLLRYKSISALLGLEWLKETIL